MILLTPTEHALIRPQCVELTASIIRPRLLEDAHSKQDKADARMDAHLLASKIVDNILGVLTTDAPASVAPVKRSLEDLLAQVA